MKTNCPHCEKILIIPSGYRSEDGTIVQSYTEEQCKEKTLLEEEEWLERKLLKEKLKNEAFELREEAQLLLKKTERELRPFGLLPWYIVVTILLLSLYCLTTCTNFFFASNDYHWTTATGFIFWYTVLFSAIFGAHTLLYYYPKKYWLARQKAFGQFIESHELGSINIYDPERILFGDKHELEREMAKK